ncbi:MAG: hypothetical protein ACRDUA_14845, partial [Micromonosporaceae bacterium]
MGPVVSDAVVSDAVVCGGPESNHDGPDGAACLASPAPVRSVMYCASCPFGSSVIGMGRPVQDNLYRAQS